MYSVSMKSTPGKIQCGWEANGSVFTSKMVSQCFFFTKVQSATLASSQTSEGLAGNCYAMIAKQVN